MSFKPNLLLFKGVVEIAIPPLLVAAGLSPMDEYILGVPSDSNYKSCGFYLGVGDEDPEGDNFKPVVQLQLPRINYEESLKYYDVVYDVLRAIDPAAVGMTVLQRFSATEFPPDQTSSSIYTFYIEYIKLVDDCDNE